MIDDDAASNGSRDTPAPGGGVLGGAEPGFVSVDVQLGPDDLREALRRDARQGLLSEPKWMSPVWFYDERGSELYEEITRLPEYYPFRVERDLLVASAGEIAEAAGASVLVELGSGTSEKTRALLRAMDRCSSGLAGYVGFDVSEAHLRAAAEGVADDFGIEVHAIMGDFGEHLEAVPDCTAPRLVAFLGSTIGNMHPGDRRSFLAEIAALLKPEDGFLLATDLAKPVERMVAAYDDSAGVTAAFNCNLIAVLNRELGASFDPDLFDHVVVWNAERSWIEMRLRATTDMKVELPALDTTVAFAEGEEMRTEISTKFTPDQVAAELADAGLATVATWTDDAGDYLLTLARPA
jgi:L-histidine N-alpha-methyltransferase